MAQVEPPAYADAVIMKTSTQENHVDRSWNTLMRNTSEQVTSSCSSFINRRPFSVMVIVILLCATLIGVGFACTSLPDISDPSKGFETRNTDLSGRVVTWSKLENEISIFYNSGMRYYRGLQRMPSAMPKVDEDEDSDNERRRRKRLAKAGKAKTSASTAISNPFESLINGGVSEWPCMQFRYDFTDDVNFVSQIVFESPSFDQLFSLSSIQALCQFQTAANSTLDPIRQFIDYPHFWSLPNYIICYHGLFSCSEITEPIVKKTAQIVQKCSEHRDLVLWCGSSVGSVFRQGSDQNCTALPAECESKYVYDMFYFILSNNIGQKGASPVYTNVVLPVLWYESYQVQGKTSITVDELIQVYQDLAQVAERVDELEFRGSSMGFTLKNYLWLYNILYEDGFFILGAFLIVYLVIWLYSGSLFFTTSVLLSVIASLLVAYCVCRLVFRLTFFPIMNLFTVILLIGIGADDTFILKHIFDTSSRKFRSATISATLSKEEMRDALSHAALSMFVCSATTAAAFYANLVSDIVTIKHFGVFAGTTMLINYLLVVTWLPASLVVLRNYLNPWFESCCPQGILQAFQKAWSKGALIPNFLLLTALPRFVMVLKYLWITVFTLIFVCACVIVFYKPRLALPAGYNPKQMFRTENPLEWYDSQMPNYFEFSQSIYKERIGMAIIFGFLPVDNNHNMEPNNMDESGKNEFEIHPEFRMDLKFLRAVDHVCRELYKADFIYQPVDCFPDLFFEWSNKQHCSSKPMANTGKCCNITHPSFDESEDLVWCLWESTKSMDIMDIGGPIFRANDSIPDGFILYFDVNDTFTTSYAGLDKFFLRADNGLKKILSASNVKSIQDGWMVTTTYITLLWYDLQRSLLRGTHIGILVSVGVALIVAVVTMRAFLLSILSVITVFAINVVLIACLILLDWHLNIVESTLLILSVGLAFDFTLNYAVAYQLSPKGTREQKVCTVLQYMGMPVFLAFLTTFLAGLIMLQSSIMAFYEIGMFMVLIAVISWLYSALFFLSLLAAFGPEECEWTLLQKLVPKLARRLTGRREAVAENGTETASGTSLGTTELTVRNSTEANGVITIFKNDAPESSN